jgi:hypothetical protein
MKVDQATLQKHLEALEAAIKQVGEDAATLNEDPKDAQRARIGGSLASIVGITAQLYGVEEVRLVLTAVVSGEQADQFWKLQRELQKSESEPEAEPKALASAP